MATNTKPIIFTITKAGKDAALQESGEGAQIKVNLTQVALGTGKYQPTGDEIALANELGERKSIVSGDIERNSNTLRFSASLRADSLTEVYEIGLMMDDGTLFAVAASDTDPLLTLHANVTFATSFGLSLADINADNVTVTTDPNGAMALVIMENHLAAPDPHPQYLNQQRFLQFLQLAYPYGHKYWTHDKANPKPLFDAMFGFETYWRRLEGVSLVAVKEGDSFIGQPMITLGQEGTTELATAGIRPHSYPIRTSYLFERYNPDDVIETVWNVSANKNSVNEGEAVRFTVTANNIPDGQILDWSVKEGELNANSNDIDAPEKTESGTVILKNGQAIIDFATTADDNENEMQKHVRLTVGVPANLSINIPISDMGVTETALHITQSTTSGMQLDEYYKQQSGRYPIETDKIRFIVDAGVDIIAPNTDTPAIEDGVNWPSGSQIVVENHGRILGRGGDGGRSAYYHRFWDDNDAPERDSNFNYSRPAENGRDGGTAVKGSIAVENYGLIAGGGGGGGGLGIYAKSGSPIYIGAGGTGGGAPLGKRSPNEATYSMYLVDPMFPVARAGKPLDSGKAYTVIYHRDEGAFAHHYNTTQGLSVGGGSTRGETRAVFYELSADDTNSYAPAGFTTYKIESVENGKISGALIMSQDATVDTAGIGGANLVPNLFHDDSGFVIGQSNYKQDGIDLVADTRGGNGGAYGENGDGGTTEQLYGISDNGSMAVINESEAIWRQASAAGGLAGYIAEGEVTITNYSAGTTKGR